MPSSHRTRPLLSALAIFLASTCSEGPTGPSTPDETPIDLSELVAGTLTAGQSVTYSIVAPADVPLLIALQTRTGSLADTLVATVSLAASDAVLATLRSAGTQTNLRDRSTTLPAAAERALLITVSGAKPSTGGAFHLEVGSITDAPEWNPTALASGTIASETIDGPGDVDEFTVQGTAGLYAGLHLAADVPFSGGLVVELLDGTTVLSSAMTTAAQTTLGEVATENVILSRTGTFTVRVRLAAPTSVQTGGYRVRLSAIQPTPPPHRRQLIVREIQVDTIAGVDSVVSWQVAWSSQTHPIGFSLEVLSSQPGDTLTATFSDEAGLNVIGTIKAAVDGGAALFDVPLVIGPPPYQLIAVIRGQHPNAQAVYRVRHGSQFADTPETVPAALVIGDTLTGETIDDSFDMDRYVFTPDPADTAFVVMLVPNTPSRELGILLYDRNHRLVEGWDVTGQYTNLERTATYLSLPDDRGPYQMVIGGGFHVWPGFTGGYRLRVVRVDRAAEGTPVPVTPGQTINGVIEQPGDIDDIRLDVVEGEEMYFHHHMPDPPVNGQGFSLLDGTTSLNKAPLASFALPIDQQRAHYLWRAPRTGSFTMRVQNGQIAGPASDFPAPYTVEVQRVNPAPEAIPGTGWIYGDTITGESIERRGDVDEFFVTFDAPQMTRLVLVAQRTGIEGGVYLTVEGPGGIGVANQSVAAPTASDTISVGPHVEFPVAGTYRFRLEGTSLSPIPYRFFLLPSHVGPEVIGDTLPVGPWITGEAIDSIGDIDRYVFPVVAGRRYVAQVELLPGSTGAVSFESDLMSARSDGTRDFGVSTTTGHMRATVGWFPSLAGLAQGPYRLRIQYSTTQPETAAPTIAIGDTIDTESLDVMYDEDEFTFSGTAGDLLRMSAVSAAQGAGARLVLHLVGAGASGDFVIDIAEGSHDFTLQFTGTFRVLVRAHMPQLERDLGPYSVSLVRR